MTRFLPALGIVTSLALSASPLGAVEKDTDGLCNTSLSSTFSEARGTFHTTSSCAIVGKKKDVYKYTLTIDNVSRSQVRVAFGSFEALHSPYAAIASDFAYRIPACRRLTLRFYSPWGADDNLTSVNIGWRTPAGRFDTAGAGEGAALLLPRHGNPIWHGRTWISPLPRMDVKGRPLRCDRGWFSIEKFRTAPAGRRSHFVFANWIAASTPPLASRPAASAAFLRLFLKRASSAGLHFPSTCLITFSSPLTFFA